MEDRPRLLLVGTHNSRVSKIMSVGEALQKQLASRGWEVLLTSTRRDKRARVVDMLRTVYVRRHDYDIAVLDVYSGRAFLWAEAVAGLLRHLENPYVLTLRGGNLPIFASRRADRLRRLLDGASAVVAPSDYLRESLAVYHPDIRLIPNPIDLRSFEYRHRTSAEARLIWLRAFDYLYNPEMAVDAASRLKGAYPYLRLTMIGPDMKDGSYEATRRKAKQLGVDDCIIWQGGVPNVEVADHLREADILLNTSNVDNMPVSVLEAMATGLCIVSTNAGGLPYLLTHGDDALLTDLKDASGMASAVGKIIAEPGLASRLSANARKKAEEFDWETVRGQWEHLLTGLTVTAA